MGELERYIEETFRKLFPLYEHIGLKIESASNGVFRCSVPLNEANSNHFQTMHAALQWASAEVLGGVVFAASEIDPREFLGVVKSVHIEFKRPAGSAIVAEAHFPDSQMQAMMKALQDHGRCDFELDAVVHNDAGETVAEAQCVYAVRRRRRSP